MNDGRHSLVGSAWRFALAGGLNTVVTGVLLTLLSLVLDARVAYTLVFAAGVVVSTYLADRYVYGVRLGRAGIAAYVTLYVLVYLVGLAAVHIWTTTGHPAAATGLVVIITAPLTFLGGRLITRRVDRTRDDTPAQHARTTEAP